MSPSHTFVGACSCNQLQAAPLRISHPGSNHAIRVLIRNFTERMAPFYKDEPATDLGFMEYGYLYCCSPEGVEASASTSSAASALTPFSLNRSAEGAFPLAQCPGYRRRLLGLARRGLIRFHGPAQRLSAARRVPAASKIAAPGHPETCALVVEDTRLYTQNVLQLYS